MNTHHTLHTNIVSLTTSPQHKSGHTSNTRHIIKLTTNHTHGNSSKYTHKVLHTHPNTPLPVLQPTPHYSIAPNQSQTIPHTHHFFPLPHSHPSQLFTTTYHTAPSHPQDGNNHPAATKTIQPPPENTKS